MSHGDHVSRIAPGFEVYATSPGAPLRSPPISARNFYAVQFHPEVHHTPNGKTLYENFVTLAGFKGDWTMGAYRDRGDREDPRTGRRRQGDLRAVGRCRQLGRRRPDPRGDRRPADLRLRRSRPLRQNEADEVVAMFRDHYNIPLIHADESERFLGALEGVSDPETKRKIIGKLFIDVFQHYATRSGCGVPGPGHALSRCHRSVSLLRWPLRHHQVAPQCRRPAREDGAEAGRTAAGAFQGRGPRPGPRTGPARRASSAATPSPAPALPSAAPARSRAKSSTSCARPMPSISTRSASTGSMTRSGRPSSPSCRCAPWA
jgi:hypothetical protein